MTSDPLLRILRLARPLRGGLAWAVVAGALTTGAGIALLAVSGFLIARAAEHPHITALALAVVAVRALGISRGVFRYAERLATHDVAFRALADVRVQIYRRLERLAPSGLRAFRSGDLLTRLVSDVDATQDLFIRGVVPPLAAVLAGGGAVAVCAVLLVPAGALLLTGLLAGGVLVPAFAAFAARRSGRRTAAARGTLAVRVIDAMAGSADLRAFGAQHRALDEVVRADGLLTAQARRDAIVQGFGAGAGQLSAGLTVWAVLLTGVAAVGQGALGRVPLAVLVLTAFAAFEAVASLPAAAAQLSGTRAAAGRIGEVLDAPLPVPEPVCPLPPPSAPATLRLRAIRVRYATDEPWVLDGVDLDLVPGRRIALVGPSGAGKSTLAALLLRFLDAQEGQALLNGADLTGFAPDDVRRVIGGCPQDPHVFDTTIKENLRLARPDATPAELAAAARRARLLPWIESLPHGWETAVGAHGASLSGGERQRVALARALLADPAILILDEPTAHLDAATSRELMSDLLEVTGRKAILLITHDPIGLEHADEILVLDGGKVTERGSHDDLIRAGGTYRQLFGGDPVHQPVPI